MKENKEFEKKTGIHLLQILIFNNDTVDFLIKHSMHTLRHFDNVIINYYFNFKLKS